MKKNISNSVFDPRSFRRDIKRLITSINLLKSDSELLFGEEKEKVTTRLLKAENQKGNMIINLRKLILKLASPKLKEFLLHTHPLAYIPKSHVSFNYKGPNYCNYITECMVYAYTHGVSGIATDEIPGDKVLLLKLKELLAKKFNLQLDLTQVIKNDGQYLGFSCFKSLHGFKFMNIN